MRAISILAAAALATAGFPASADEGRPAMRPAPDALRLAQADEGVDQEVLEEAADEELPGIGLPGIGMEGLGMDGVGMEGIGMEGIGMDPVPGEEIEPVILRNGTVVEVRLTDAGIVLSPAASAAEDAPALDETRFEIANIGSAAHRFVLGSEARGDDLDIASEILDPGERTALSADLPDGIYEAYDPLLDDAANQEPVIVGVR